MIDYYTLLFFFYKGMQIVAEHNTDYSTKREFWGREGVTMWDPFLIWYNVISDVVLDVYFKIVRYGLGLYNVTNPIWPP
jgi:hypothetical protein